MFYLTVVLALWLISRKMLFGILNLISRVLREERKLTAMGTLEPHAMQASKEALLVSLREADSGHSDVENNQKYLQNWSHAIKSERYDRIWLLQRG